MFSIFAETRPSGIPPAGGLLPAATISLWRSRMNRLEEAAKERDPDKLAACQVAIDAMQRPGDR